MKKTRFLSAAIAFTLLLAALPGGALAASWPPESSDNWTDLSLGEAEELLTHVSDGTAATDVLLVYYSEQCGYSKNCVPQFIECAAKNGLRIQGYDQMRGGELYSFFALAEAKTVGFPAVVLYNSASGEYVVSDMVRSLVAFEEMLTKAGLTNGAGEDQPTRPPTTTRPDTTGANAWSGGWDDIPDTGVAYASTQTVDIDGQAVEFEMYALKDTNGNDTNYIKVRDLARALQGTGARFSVDWDGLVRLRSGGSYTVNGSEFSTPFQGDRAYRAVSGATVVNGVSRSLQAILLTDDSGGGYTYYKLRDLGRYLGFNVGWSARRGVSIETAEPYKG